MIKGTPIEAMGKRFQLCHFTGRVTATRKQKETRVKGSGGGSSGYGAYQSTSAVKITSQTIDHHELFLLDQAGDERSFNIVDFDFPCREGQTLSVTWVVPEGAAQGPVIQARNHNAQETYVADRRHLKGFGSMPLRLMSFVKLAAVLVLLGLAMGALSEGMWIGWLLLGAGVWLPVSAVLRRRKLEAAVVAAITGAAMQLDGRLAQIQPLPAANPAMERVGA